MHPVGLSKFNPIFLELNCIKINPVQIGTNQTSSKWLK